MAEQGQHVKLHVQRVQSHVRRNLDIIRENYGGGPEKPLSSIYWPHCLRIILLKIIEVSPDDLKSEWEWQERESDLKEKLAVSSKEYLHVAYKRAALQLLDLVYKRARLERPFEGIFRLVFCRGPSEDSRSRSRAGRKISPPAKTYFQT